MGGTLTDPCCNHLLSSLAKTEYSRIAPLLTLVELEHGDVLCESGDQMRHIYFPTTAVVSLHYVLENGASAEIAVIGNEGLLGIELLMGGSTTPSRAVVHCKGWAYRLRPSILLAEFKLGGNTQQLLLRYTQALMTQMTQIAVCNRHHSVEQQLCRWLLLSSDRALGNTLNVTHELIANMLGVRRESVTEAAGRLQREKLIRYSRGRIDILDKARLESHGCECYQVVRTEFERLLPVNEDYSCVQPEPALSLP